MAGHRRIHRGLQRREDRGSKRHRAGIAGLREAYDEILVRSSIDCLTGIRNRSSLFGHIQARHAEMANLDALLFIDVDNFKLINDTYGHVAGDHVLRTIARRLADQCDADMSIGRIGGDEFVVAVFSAVPAAAARRALVLAERMRSACCAPFRISGDGVQVMISVSIGVAHNENGTGSLDSMLAAADQALYEEKRTVMHNRVLQLRRRT